MSLNLPLAVERAVRERVESGTYPSEETVFATCLQALNEFETNHGIRWRPPELYEDVESYSPDADELSRMERLYAHLNTRRIARRLAKGCYISVGDVINSALMAYDELDAEDAADDVLRAEIDEAIAALERGEGIPAEEVFAHIQEHLARLYEAATAACDGLTAAKRVGQDAGEPAA